MRSESAPVASRKSTWGATMPHRPVKKIAGEASRSLQTSSRDGEHVGSSPTVETVCPFRSSLKVGGGARVAAPRRARTADQ